MKLSIAKKLGLGFGAIMIVMVVSAIITSVNLRSMNHNVTKMLDEATPAVRACDRLMSATNQSLAALRGYLILGDDPKDAKSYKADRADAWRDIDAAFSDLDRYAQRWDEEKDRRNVAQIKHLLDELRNAQQKIEDVAHTKRNIKSDAAMRSEVEPRIAIVRKKLSSVMAEEMKQDASADRRELLEAVAASQASFAMCLANIRAFLQSGDKTFKDRFNEEWRRNTTAFNKAKAQSRNLTASQRPDWDRYVEVRAELQPLTAKIFTLRQADDWNQAEYGLETEAAPRVRTLKKQLAAVTESVENLKEKRRAELDAASGLVSISLFAATALGITVGIIIAVLLSRRIVSTVRTLAGRANEIAEGDLTGTAMLAKSGDELGQLADSFDVMLGNLRELTGQISSVTENVNSAASQISSSAKQQSVSTKEQAATVQEVTSTMQEIAQTGAQIVERAKEVAAAAEATAQQSKSGIAAVQGTSRTMESIRDQVEEVAENIVALSEKTQAVGDVISTVNEIAEQSNLLALNAAIEAAEAGDDGNRFSVVANEMKNLADRAKDCTVQVRTILGEIQKGINSAVMLTEEAVKRVEAGKQQANVSEDAIRKMSETTDESVQAFQQIIGATNQQQVGFEQITKGMQDIDQATQQTAAGTAQLEQAVVSLSSMSQQLRSAVSNYRLQA
jgi:methyl-accepting chemotaxis protein